MMKRKILIVLSCVYMLAPIGLTTTDIRIEQCIEVIRSFCRKAEYSDIEKNVSFLDSFVKMFEYYESKLINATHRDANKLGWALNEVFYKYRVNQQDNGIELSEEQNKIYEQARAAAIEWGKKSGYYTRDGTFDSDGYLLVETKKFEVEQYKEHLQRCSGRLSKQYSLDNEICFIYFLVEDGVKISELVSLLTVNDWRALDSYCNKKFSDLDSEKTRKIFHDDDERRNLLGGKDIISMCIKIIDYNLRLKEKEDSNQPAQHRLLQKYNSI